MEEKITRTVSSDSVASVTSVASDTGDSKERGFISKFVDFLLGRSADDNTRDLKLIQKRLFKAGCKFYNVSKDKVLVDFADLLFEVYKTVAPLREFFLARNNNAYYAESAIRYFMSDKQTKMHSLLESSHIEEVSKTMNFEQLKAKVISTYNAFEKSFEADVVARITDTYNAVLVLKQFCILDFYVILRNFSGELKENVFTEKVKFYPMAKGYFVDYIPDFLANTVNLLAIEDWGDVFAFLGMLPGYKGMEMSVFTGMLDRLMLINAKGAFVDFGRLFLHDENFTLSAKLPREDIVMPFVEEVKQSVKEVLNTLYLQKKNELVSRQVKKVFGDNLAAPLKNYNKDMSMQIADIAPGENIYYTHWQRVYYYHCFFDLFMRSEIPYFADTFGVSAITPDVKYSSHLSAELHSLEEIEAEILKLDMNLGSNFARGYKLQAAAERATTPDGVAKFRMEVDQINVDFNKQINFAIRQLRSVLGKFKDLVDDYNIVSHVLVENWDEVDRSLKDSAGKVLPEFGNHIKDFLVLMECFE